jgi:hypothetical protein
MFIIDTSEDPYFGHSYPEPEPEKNPFNCPVPFLLAPRAEVWKRTGICCAETPALLFEAAEVVEKLQGPYQLRVLSSLRNTPPSWRVQVTKLLTAIFYFLVENIINTDSYVLIKI